MTKKTFSIKGMNCNSCAMLIEKELNNKVNSVSASFSKEQAEIDFDENKISENEIKAVINKLGYEAEAIESKESSSEEEKEEDSTSDDYPIINTESEENNKDKYIVIEPKKENLTAENKKPKVHKSKDIITNKSTDYKKSDIKLTINSEKNLSDKIGWIFVVISSIILVLVLFHFFQGHIKVPEFNELKIPEGGERAGLFLLFAAGILTGFHCVSMCGGFVVSYTAKNAMNGHKSFKQHLVYGGSKVISYTIIGGVFGLIGGIIAFSVGLRAGVAIFAGVFMVFYALSMFGLKFFRKFQFNPKFLTRFIIAQANAKGPYKGPMVTGLLNGLFIACGPLQAMYLYAAGTGNFFTGATSLAVFGLGTLPIMIGFGSFATVISHKTTQKILKISAIIVLILGLIMLNRGLTMIGSPYNYESLKTKIIGGDSIAVGTSPVAITNGVQEVNMDVSGSGYSPNSFVLKKGVPVKWNINVKQLTGCNSELIANNFNIDINLKQGLNTAEFTPDKVGTFSFSCGMGMLKGSFIVTETGSASQQEVTAATPPKGMQCGGGSGGGGCGCGG